MGNVVAMVPAYRVNRSWGEPATLGMLDAYWTYHHLTCPWPVQRRAQLCMQVSARDPNSTCGAQGEAIP